jgi:aminopeptidase N
MTPHEQSETPARYDGLLRRTRLFRVPAAAYLLGAVLAGAVATTVALLVLVVVLGPATGGMDEATLGWVSAHQNEVGQRTALQVTALGNTLTLSVLMFWVAAFLLATRRRFEAVVVVAAFAGGRILNEGLKSLFQRPRPDALEWGTHVVSASFPSAHAMSATIAFGTIAYLVGWLGAGRGVKRVSWLLAAMLAAGVAASRVYLGVHYPTDSGAGVIAGALWTAIVLSALHAARPVPEPEMQRRARSASRLAPMVAFALAGAAGPAAAQLTDPGVSLELARHRAETLTDVRYDLAFHVPSRTDLPVTGVLELAFVRDDDGPVILDFAAPAAVRSVHVGGARVDAAAANNHLVLPAAALAPGENRVRIEFIAGDGPLNRHDDFLYTLFVPARAHEAFPAFDQPDMKARFRLRLTVPEGWVAVANGEEIERRDDDGWTNYRFAETEPLSTYLFAFVAGRFEVAEAQRAGRTMRFFHRESDPERVARNLAPVFDLHATALAWLEDYTGIPYPFGKFDFVAIPSFQYNGMEHPGAVLYRASSLFLDPSATRAQELGRASLIAHETAHMWFGDLVTMPWFDDVWMKEVFANFMAAKIVNPAFPDLDHELRFFLAHYPAAYAVDRTPGANPIRQRLDNLDDAASLYGPIIYQKAPIVMRQLERLSGEDELRTAVRGYLEAHAFGNAGWPELIAYLDRVAGMDVPAWSRVWIEEPGRPTIRVERGEAGVRLAQADPWGLGRLWDQVTTVRIMPPQGGIDRVIRLDGPTAVVDLPPPIVAAGAPILPNGAGLGYGLFILDPGSKEALLHALPAIREPLARAVGWVALYEMMLEHQVDPGRMMELALTVVHEEEDELVAQAVLDDAVEIFWHWLGPDQRRAAAGRVEATLWNRTGTARGASHKAAVFNAWRAIATSPASLALMERIWSGQDSVPGLPLAEPDRTILALQLAVHLEHRATTILDTQADRIDNADRRARFAFVRQAVDPDRAARDAFFASLAEPASRHREEWVTTALQYLSHPVRADQAIPYIRPGLELLREIRESGDIFFPQRWLDALLGGHSSTHAAAIVSEFIGVQKDYPPRLMGKLLQSADPLFRRAATAAEAGR